MCYVFFIQLLISQLPAVSLNMLKHYLGRILGQCEGSEENASDPLQFYYQPTRKEIGVILTSNAELSSPGPYIPTFYKRCSFIKISADCEVCMHVHHVFVFWSLCTSSHSICTLLPSFIQTRKSCVICVLQVALLNVQ